jgi:hypothetical protein
VPLRHICKLIAEGDCELLSVCPDETTRIPPDEFREILYWRFLVTFLEIKQFWLKSDGSDRQFT